MKLTSLWIAAAFLTCAALAQNGKSDSPHAIVSISVCAPGTSTAAGNCIDTSQPVVAPDGVTQINGYGGLATMSDEHATIFPPGTLPDHPDYLIFAASRTAINPTSSGLVVLTGGPGPNSSGQWTLDFASDFGLYNPANPPGSQNGQIFLSPMDHSSCEPNKVDATFDLNYADPGTVLVDPTNRANKGPSSLIMIYEGTNRCVGLSGNTNKGNKFYSSIGVATSLDRAHTWPAYRNNFVSLPNQNSSAGPHDPLGATGNDVCEGNDCSPAPPANYGRYAVLGPVVTLAEAFKQSAGAGLNPQVGDSEPSAFLDEMANGPDQYLYVVHNYTPGGFAKNPQISPPYNLNSDLMIARTLLNRGSDQLAFYKWFGGQFNEPGLGNNQGGHQDPIFSVDPAGYSNCLAPDQARAMGSISYVEETQQYLLLFVCASPSDPGATSDPGKGGQKGAAWFYSTIDAKQADLSRQDLWSAPSEIDGSWSKFIGDPGSACFRNFNGWYPSIMSLDHKPGRLTTSGYVFYVNGCTDDETPGGRIYSTRSFTIRTK